MSIESYFKELRYLDLKDKYLNLNENNQIFNIIDKNRQVVFADDKLLEQLEVEVSKLLKPLYLLGEYECKDESGCYLKQTSLDFTYNSNIASFCFYEGSNDEIPFIGNISITDKFSIFYIIYDNEHKFFTNKAEKVEITKFPMWVANYYRQVKQWIKDGLLVKK